MKSSNVIYHQASVTRQRRNKLNKHRSVVLWFTGLSGSGKSTLAHALEEKLFQKGCRTFVLDGDNVRHGLNSNLDFSDADRGENIRRISEVSKLMLEAGLIVMTAFISPFTEDRNTARNLIKNDNFIEIYCKASIETCEKRDVKGLYKKARAGKIKNYTGIDSPYEAPVNPELIINTDKESLDESISKILSYLQENILKS
ncbi:adenylyl-sulfate kinase [Candidatus Pseudothioglobus sp. Uisw_016]|jgi:adenylylsulfate kinase|uniref:adenylyl-sulfate kinase n=1 Tax=Candidatus Pseudothioglobus sp. Uisw_016 TaxID=3230995 RepID=UPI0023747F81|nr:adenylyl-sulfate kinase [Candidatus Thioglobus sp.]